MTDRRSAYGFGVRADRPLQFLRDDGAEDIIEVGTLHNPPPEPNTPPAVEWHFREAPGVSARLHRHGSGYGYWTAGGAALIEPSRRTVLMPPVADDVLWEEHLWGVPALLCFLERGDLPLHAAVVEVGGGAVLLAAPGRFGKTTLALHCHLAGHRVLGEDLACCRVHGDTPVVLPGPALLRVRLDVLPETPIPDMQAVLHKPGRVYLGIGPERRGSGSPVPLRAIAFLRSDAHRTRAEPVSPTTALPDLWALSFKLPGGEPRARTFKGITRLADIVPMWNIHRPLDRPSIDGVLDIIDRIGSGLALGS